jgi:DNA-binding GntR family transcriptional regulator
MGQIGRNKAMIEQRSATLAQVVADVIRQRIREGEFVPAQRLRELALAQEISVSQSTVRDALRLLEAEGWVRYAPRLGVRVRSFTADEAWEVFTLIATLERLALEWVFSDLSRVDLLQVLRPPLADIQSAHECEDWAARREALFRFHQGLGGLIDRPQTQALLANLHTQALLLQTDFELRGNPLPVRAAQTAGYQQLAGMLTFANPDLAIAALGERIMDDGRPIVRWLTLYG